MESNIIEKSVDTMRVVACETVTHANSGHSGIALGAAPLLYSAYKEMKIDPSAGEWFNRDRFVMSAGHGSALLYTTLHFMGYPISSDDLKTFRTLGSHLAGHPELNERLGIDCVTGPLGQGVAMAVGIALAEKKLAETYNRPGFEVINHHTFCVCGDGCLMEGVSYESCNLAGLWGLGKLILLYDSNGITLDGTRTNADCEDVAARFTAMRWRVFTVDNGNSAEAVSRAIAQATTSDGAPTIIICKTCIGYGSKSENSHKAHGAVFTREETAEMRKKFGLREQLFMADEDVIKHFETLAKARKGSAQKWQAVFDNEYKKAYPKEHAALSEFIQKPKKSYNLSHDSAAPSLRETGGEMLNRIALTNPRLIGGSADVSSTTKAYVTQEIKAAVELDRGYSAATLEPIAFGVREFSMAAICNGLALHGFMPYCSTFLAFSDYAKPAIRLSALMNLPVIYVFTHDGLGNAPDGPTHQATEHIAALRIVPGLHVFRPSDSAEIAEIYQHVFSEQFPASIILSRGGALPFQRKTVDRLLSGSFVGEVFNKPKAALLSSGTEVSLCTETQKVLAARGINVNVISIPCLETFDVSLLEKNIPTIAVEIGSSVPWYKFTQNVVGFDRFGYSGPNKDVMKKLGFTSEDIAVQVADVINKNKQKGQ